MTRTKEEIYADMIALTKEVECFNAKKQREKEQAVFEKLKIGADSIAHAVKSAAFIEYESSRAYIDSVKSECNLSAVADFTGEQLKLKHLGADRYLTFNSLNPAQTIILSGDRKAIVKSFVHSFAGSEFELIHLTSKFLIEGQPVTPYSAIDCRLDHVTKQLIVPKGVSLPTDTIISISGERYRVDSQYHESTHKRFQLEKL
jgi:hypothetical protein